MELWVWFSDSNGLLLWILKVSKRAVKFVSPPSLLYKANGLAKLFLLKVQKKQTCYLKLCNHKLGPWCKSRFL